MAPAYPPAAGVHDPFVEVFGLAEEHQDARTGLRVAHVVRRQVRPWPDTEVPDPEVELVALDMSVDGVGLQVRPLRHDRRKAFVRCSLGLGPCSPGSRPAARKRGISTREGPRDGPLHISRPVDHVLWGRQCGPGNIDSGVGTVDDMAHEPPARAPSGTGGSYRPREVAGIVLFLAIFVVASSVFGVSEIRSYRGGSWWDGFLSNLRTVAPFSVPMAALMIFATRRSADGMPEELWVHGGAVGTRPQRYQIRPTYRWLTLGGLALVALVAPFAIDEASREAWDVGLFFVCWAVVIAAAIYYRLAREPEALTLVDDVLRVETNPLRRRFRDIPVSSIEEILWPTFGDRITIVHGGKKLHMTKRTDRLDQLVVDLRRQNPQIRFSGPWPPKQWRSSAW